ncbi:MAG: XdhC family protein [Bacteriovoracaceae bacterium]|nr:XdhC family protein [Bacteriovoracaceae bacterium]
MPKISCPLSTTSDPVMDFFSKVQILRSENRPYAIATVIEVLGSASARTSSKAIFDQDGVNLLGWVGGGCAERFIGEEAVQAIREGKTRIVLADLDDEIFGLGVACGGKMRVFIDPILPAEVMMLPQTDQFHNEIRSLGGFYGWNIQEDLKLDPPQSIEDLLLLMATTAADKRDVTAKSLREIKKVPATFKTVNSQPYLKEVTIVGRTRITEALARHFTLLNYSVRVVGPDLKSENYPTNVKCHCLEDSYEHIDFHKGEVVVIAGHTAQDPLLVEKALNQKASHVAMIGSLKRSHEVLNHLKLMNQEVTLPLYIPAGLDLNAKNPDEIALSVISEVILEKRKSE